MSKKIDRGVVNKFNRGEVSSKAFAREDVDRLQNSCALMENFKPERLGPMSYRSGSEHIRDADDDSVIIPFVKGLTDSHILNFEHASGVYRMRVLDENDSVISYTATTSTLTNGSFDSPIGTGWIDDDEGSATSVQGTGRVTMTGTDVDTARIYQTLTTFQQSVAHAFEIEIRYGSVTLQLGTSGVESADLFEVKLEAGKHFIEVTPGLTAITVTLSNGSSVPVQIETCRLAPTGDIDFNFEVMFGITMLGGFETWRRLSTAQSANFMYCAGPHMIPFVVKRRNDRSYSVENFINLFGPYEELNISAITMDPSAAGKGDISVVNSASFFTKPPETYDFDLGTSIRLATTGQNRTITGSANDAATEGVFVFGVGDARRVTVDINTTGAYNAVWLEKSFDEITWQKVKEYTTGLDFNEVYDDKLDGVEVFYRLRVEDIGVATTIDLTMTYDYGTLEGEGRIYSSPNTATVNVLFYTPVGSDQVTRDWYIGSWGGRTPHPTAVALYQGRLWFGGNNKIWGSESDFYESFNRNVEGASRSIQKTIGFGSSGNVLWLAPSARLVAGLPTSEVDVRSTAFGEVLTQDNTNLKNGSTMGCSPVLPLVIDDEVIFVQAGGDKVVGIDFNIQSEKHAIEDFNMLHPEICSPGIVSMAYSRNPETRIFLVMADGTMRVLLRDQVEDILGWSRVTAPAGRSYVDVCVLPGPNGDRVYVTTKDSVSSNFGAIEKFALQEEARGKSISKHFDRFLHLTTWTSTVQVNHLKTGEDVGVWIDGVDQGDFTTTGGSPFIINVPTGGSNLIVGKRYVAKYKSPKLGDYTNMSVLAANKRIIDTALIMGDYIEGALTIGPEESLLSPMPAIEKGTTAADDDEYDELPFEYDGISETDPRIHMQATGPCSIQALVYEVKNTDRREKANE